jgi:RNA polymerase sigma factor for flagellar operon FliA
MMRRAPGSGLQLIERPIQVEASLWRRLRFERETGCRETLFSRHIAMARAIAGGEFRRRPPYGLEKSDFEQLAFGGLLEAIDRYDPLRGAPFDAFARHRIRGAIADGIAASSESAAQYVHRRRIEGERLRSIQSGRGETNDFIGELSAMTAALAIGIVAESARILDATPEMEGLDAYESLSWRDLQMSVLREIERLPEAEKSLMRQHYLNGVSFAQISQLLGLSRGRVSQLHRAALMRVRERLKYSE